MKGPAPIQSSIGTTQETLRIITPSVVPMALQNDFAAFSPGLTSWAIVWRHFVTDLI